MRRASVVIASLAVLLMLPSTAFAWWDFIEQFSGPRKFWGPDIQLRLFCVVETDQQVVSYTEPQDQTQPQIRVKTERRSEIRTAAPIGLLLSVCRAEDRDRERLAFDIGARFMWSRRYKDQQEPDFANGSTIKFTTLEPAVMFPLARNKKGWRLDYGFGAGVYWFSSEGFPSFNGAFIEPVRFDLHFPIKFWKVNSIIVRGAALYFPAGFDPDAWAGDADHNNRLAGELVPTYAIFADVTAVAKAATEKLGLRWAD